MTTNGETGQRNNWITFSLMKTLTHNDVTHILKKIKNKWPVWNVLEYILM